MSEAGPDYGGLTIDELFAEPPRQPRDWRRLPRLIRQSLTLTWHAGRNQFIIVSAVELLQGLVAAAQVLLTRELILAVQGEKAVAATKLGSVLLVLGFFVIVFTLSRFAGALQIEQSELLQELVTNKTRREMMVVAGQQDLIAFENSSFYDRLQRATQSASFRSMEMVQSLVALMGSTARVVGLIIAVVVLKPVLLVPIAFAYIPLWYATRRNSADTYQFFFGMTPLERQRDYLHTLLTDRGTAKEIRAFGLVDFVTARFDVLSEQHVKERRRVIRRRLNRHLLVGLETTLLMAGTVGLIAWFYASGQMSLAAAGAALLALVQLSGALSVMGMGGGGLYQSSLFLDDYASFMAMEGTKTPVRPARSAPDAFHDLAVEQVTFSYPGTSARALADVSLRIRAGEVVALVGENGSGKTTLAKLLAGLYRPDTGRILWDGIDTADYDLDDLRQHVTVVFQDFLHYQMTARENIGLGRNEQLHDMAAIETAARMAGAHDFIASLPNGFESVLGREFLGGQDLSIGQWQRLAIARAFFRNAPFVVLDEPTASLDARAEAQIFERVRELFRDRSVLLISHRFATVRSADYIYVLESGQIIEHGDHNALVAKGGLYAELFRLQAAAYLGEEEE